MILHSKYMSSQNPVRLAHTICNEIFADKRHPIDLNSNSRNALCRNEKLTHRAEKPAEGSLG